MQKCDWRPLQVRLAFAGMLGTTFAQYLTDRQIKSKMDHSEEIMHSRAPALPSPPPPPVEQVGLMLRAVIAFQQMHSNHQTKLWHNMLPAAIS